jgi:hypothetical protein
MIERWYDRRTARLDDRCEWATDHELGLTVIAGEEALAGHSARVRAAERGLHTAENAFEQDRARHQEATREAERREDDHSRAMAAAGAPMSRP